MGLFNRKFNSLRSIIWRNIPELLKPYVALIYYFIKSPGNYRKDFNTSKYIVAVGKNEYINYKPLVLAATISTQCNLRCPSCLYILKDADVFKGGGFIKIDDFENLVDKYGENTEIVWLGGGEPLLHPELDDLIKMLVNKGLSVRISTNGILVEENIDSLKLTDFVNVSIDGYDYESFKRLRGGTHRQFDKVIVGLSLLKQNNITFMNSFLLTEENLGEIFKMLDFANRSMPSIVSFHNINPHGSEDFTPLTLGSPKVKQNIKDIMSKNDYPFDISLPVIFDTESEHFKTAKCIQPWYYCCFDDKGDISYCCHMRHNRSIGNIFEDYDFNSSMMRKFRHLFITNQYPEDCKYCQRRFKGEEYSYFDSKNKEWRSPSSRDWYQHD